MILPVGLPGSGKTTVATKLERDTTPCAYRPPGSNWLEWAQNRCPSRRFAGGRGGFEWTDGPIGMDLGEVLGLLADLTKAYRPA
jgi:hypothetical protein